MNLQPQRGCINQEELLQHHVSDLFFAAVVEIAREKKWVSNEHFSADGTLIEAWASMKSFRPKDDQEGLEAALRG